jgi:signal transduction histidine kinase
VDVAGLPLAKLVRLTEQVLANLLSNAVLHTPGTPFEVRAVEVNQLVIGP